MLVWIVGVWVTSERLILCSLLSGLLVFRVLDFSVVCVLFFLVGVFGCW